MKDYNSLSHSVWDCERRIVWTPKRRRKRLHGEAAPHLGGIFHELAERREKAR
jgi:putative transposase